MKLNPKLTNKKRFITKSDTSETIASFASSPFYGDVTVGSYVEKLVAEKVSKRY